MSPEISLDIKQKLFEALQKSVQQAETGGRLEAPSSDTESFASPTDPSPSQFKKLAQQIRSLEASNTDGFYDDVTPDLLPIAEAQELKHLTPETFAETISETLEPVEDLDVLFPWSKTGEAPPMPLTETHAIETLEPETEESPEELPLEEMQWNLESPEDGPRQSLHELAEALEPPEPILMEDEIREASERLARHLEEVERDLADLSGDTALESNIPSGITQEVYQASSKYDFASLYHPPQEDTTNGSLEEAMPPVQNTRPPEATAPQKVSAKTDFNATLSVRRSGSQPGSQEKALHPPWSETPEVAVKPDEQDVTLLETDPKGGKMADLSGYKDLSKAPLSLGDAKGEGATSVLSGPAPRLHEQSFSVTTETFLSETSGAPAEVDGDVNSNFQTLIRLINELPEGVTKQTGAQIIRLTMESMGIFMEDVLSDAQAAQSEMLDAVRANIKKIEEYKTIIRKLETDIKYYQTKANELSEIIDLFILSNTSSKVPNVDEYTR